MSLCAYGLYSPTVPLDLGSKVVRFNIYKHTNGYKWILDQAFIPESLFFLLVVVTLSKMFLMGFFCLDMNLKE